MGRKKKSTTRPTSTSWWSLFNKLGGHRRTPVKTHSSSYFISLLNISWLPTEQIAPCLYFLWLWMHGFQNQPNNSILKIFLRLHTSWKPMTFILLKTKLEKKYAHNNVWKCIRYIVSPNITCLLLFKIPGKQSVPPYYPVLSHKSQDTSILGTMQVSKRASFQDTNTEDLSPPPPDIRPLNSSRSGSLLPQTQCSWRRQIKKSYRERKGKKREKNRRLAKKRKTFKKQEKEMQRENSWQERWNLGVPQVLQGNHTSKKNPFFFSL